MSVGNAVMKQKRSTVTSVPGSLEFGQLGVSDVGGNTRLFVGDQTTAVKEFQAKTTLLTNFLANSNNTNGNRASIVAISGSFEQAYLVTYEYTDPTQAWDITQGFIPGSIVYNANNGKLWMALDTGEGAGEWQLVSSPSTPIVAPLSYRGVLDCSANPNYPAAEIGWVYVISVPGKIGGASGVAVEAGDMLLCKETSPGGAQGAVGSQFDVVQGNTNGAVVFGGASAGLNTVPVFSTADGKTIESSGALISDLPVSQSLAKRTTSGSIRARDFIPAVALDTSATQYEIFLNANSPAILYLQGTSSEIGLGVLPDSKSLELAREYTIVNTGSADIEVHAWDDNAPGNVSATLWWMGYRQSVTHFRLISSTADGSGVWSATSIPLANDKFEVNARDIRRSKQAHEGASTLSISLTENSDRVQEFRNQNTPGQQSSLTLPNATLLDVMTEYWVINNTDDAMSVKNSTGTSLAGISSPSHRKFTLVDNSTPQGIWDVSVNIADIDGGPF
ncbi:hypothetical protein ACMV5I_23690 [Serratia sp. T13T92]|uniref:hypothetical protein n=1 Tax=Serratia sp. T13T92 TaxID=3397496 RepID=UPI0039DF3648